MGWDFSHRELGMTNRAFFEREFSHGTLDARTEFVGTAMVGSTFYAAVRTLATGEIWALVTRDSPRFFWRSRPENPITTWYVKQCDGLVRTPNWHVFWRGLPVETIDPAVRQALGAESDFVAAA